MNRDRLRVDPRKWLLSKALPKIYGDKLTAELTGKDGAPLEPQETPLALARVSPSSSSWPSARWERRSVKPSGWPRWTAEKGTRGGTKGRLSPQSDNVAAIEGPLPSAEGEALCSSTGGTRCDWTRSR